MPCKIVIRKNITEDVEKKTESGLSMSVENANKLADKVNKSFGVKVVSFVLQGDYVSRDIEVPNSLVDQYFENEKLIEKTELEEDARDVQRKDAERAGVEYTDEYLFQKEAVPASRASVETLSKVKEVIKKIGVNLQTLAEYLKGNPNVEAKGINALTDLLHGIIAIAEGKENIATTEEMVHVATAIIEQKNPMLITEMINKIDRFSIYKQVLNQYKDDVNYQTKDRKPNIRKIKKEAVDKLIAELVVKQNEGSTEFPDLLDETKKSTIRTWWNKILDWFRRQYKKANIDVFEDTAKKIMSEELGTINDINDNQIYLQNEFSKFQSEKINLERRKTIIPEGFKILWHNSVNERTNVLNRTTFNTVGSKMDNSIYRTYDGRSFKNLSTSLHERNIDVARREILTHTIVRFTQSLYGNEFNRRLANKLGLEGFTIVNLNDKPPLFTQRGILYLNINENSSNNLFDHILKFSDENNENDLLDTAISEELIHIVSTKLTSPDEQAKAYAELSHEDKLKILQTYYHNINKTNTEELTPYKYVHEYVRMQIQKEVLGVTTEETRTTLKKIVDKVWNYLKELLPKYTSLKSIYDKTLNFIETGKEELNKTSSNNILGLSSVSDAQKKVQQDILETSKNIKKVYEPGKTDPLFQDTEEADNWYEIQKADGTWERIKKRVTDRVKQWYKQRFPDKQFTTEEKAKNELKRVFGLKGHAFLDEIKGRLFNDDGTRREVAGERPIITDPVESQVYNKLDKWFNDFIHPFFEDGKTPLVFSEEIIYDSKEKEAGTLDLHIVEEDGTEHIIDYKFLEVGKDSKDIAWFKQGAFNIQLGRYKEIRKENGAKKFGMNRAIPFLIKIERENSKDNKSPFIIKGITAGSADVSKIEDLRLVPVSEKSESTGNDEVDELLTHINSIMAQVSKEQTTNDEEREFKTERLNDMRKALRLIQGRGILKPVIEIIDNTKEQGDRIISDWNSLYKDKPASAEDINNKELSDFGIRLKEFQNIVTVVGDFSTLLDPILYDEKTGKDILEDGKEIADKIAKQIRYIQKSEKDINKIINDYGDKFVGERNLVTDLSKPEPVLKAFLKAKFYNVTDLPNKALRVLTKLVTTANLAASRTAFSQVKRLMEIREKFVKRGDVHKLVQQIYQKDDKGKIVNKLIYRYSRDFYDMLKANAEEGQRSKKVIIDNIDIEAYKTKAKEILENRIARLNSMYKEDEEKRDDLILQEKRKWDIDRKDFNGWNNWLIDNYPLEKWYSEEYKNIRKDSDLNSLYDFISEINEEAREAGYIDGAVRNTFLPFIKRTTAEAIAWGVNPSIINNWFDKLTVAENSYGRGNINELSKEVEYSLPKYYTYDFTRKEDGTHDYSEISEEIFKNMALYINHMQKYKNLKEIEGQIKILRTVEELKNHIRTNKSGNVGDEAIIEKGNKENLETLDRFINALFYGQKYGGDEDITWNVHPFNATGKLINRMAGKEIFAVDEKPDPISLTKCMDALNSYFRVKTLGGNFMSGAAVYFGSNMQVLSQAGKYFKESEFLKNTLTLIGDKFANNDERKMFLQLMDAFVPIRSDRIQSEISKAGITAFSRINFNGILMSVLTEPSEHVEKAIFMSLLNNMMIEDGKIVNITDFVNNKYKNRWESAAIHKEVAGKIKAEIAELKKTRSIDAIKKLDAEGKLVIPGLDLSNIKEIDRLTNLTRSIARTSTHGRTSADVNQFGMNVWTNSMQVFKTWIPKLMISRFRQFERINDDFNVVMDDDGHTDGERYDVGRFRLFMNVIGRQITGRSSGIINILSANEKGVESLNQMYEDYAKDYKYRTGHTMNMNKDEFFDLIRTNLRNEVRELAVLFSLLGALFATGYFAPGNDEDKAAKNAHNYYVRIMDKFVTQLSFFYNPVEFQNILGGGMFPAIGMFADISKFTHNMIMETTGFDITKPTLTPEEVYQKAQPIKYGMQLFPIGKAAITYMSMFDADFAKAFNVTISDKVQK